MNFFPKIAPWALLFVFAVPLASNADEPGRHPAYRHALSELRTARWLIQHREGDMAMQWKEDEAVGQIDGAIEDLKHAAADDGKNLDDHQPVDAPQELRGRLRNAHELLEGARSDISGVEDDPVARQSRNHAFEHVEHALREVERARKEIEEHR
jgi:hypothetical protein